MSSFFGLFMIRLWSGSQAIVDCSLVPVGGQSICMLCWFRVVYGVWSEWLIVVDAGGRDIVTVVFV